MADFDLIVIGGGPGGATLATFVAKQGHKVLLLERERFPRHQILKAASPARSLCHERRDALA
jgi:halogenation protein CepH